ncbi:MAG: RnfABCDGE type electron transport complex subunit D [Candidatus Brocadia sp. AMX2]|uniref:Na+-transporting NADH:ubiquinone oxidoreductase subunit B n=2 Tax=Candidatus Brocadiaceae TaxID=1127830 RepID=A0ABQ0JXG3_9BACT|nr:MAG: Na+-translocating NADH-quinone reductase subunit B [Candidatus Brocadia sinica]MBC6932039.1 RnfABCDGE type electron transport complex subunit D [Candidatus Brocadia sp.]MBL1169492.1 RnfABCDGE type electron transport complex subunit D [Candidatus Brocadia sp. AMX1]MCE7866344.1 RnfABCDGE type electron transport complex subunit D [Candidatus Brocadia sp. AMX2]GAN33400.1 Na+-transporting NADH:ubiquinone oxidoreductase subunit B [Candidatus Brocadia sinica JPN1]
MLSSPKVLKQEIMLRVLYSLIPVGVVAVYFFGWCIASVIAVSMIFAFLTEWVMASLRKGKISYACFVTAGIYALSLPPTTPLWIVTVGIIIAILFAKEMFGGFGKNVFNPAIVGRGFVFVCFPIELTGRFVPVFTGFPGGFGHWSMAGLEQTPQFIAEAGLKVVDAITAATPMWTNRDYGFTSSIVSLFLGNIGTIFEYEGKKMVLAAGSAGEVSALVILLSGAYLLWTKTANWRLTLSTLLGAIISSLVFRYAFGIRTVPPPLFTLFSGALFYAAVFMVTDPVSAPKVTLSQWIYGFFIGTMIVVFRSKSIFAGGAAFSILLGNILAPSLDLWISRMKSPEKGTAPDSKGVVSP